MVQMMPCDIWLDELNLTCFPSRIFQRAYSETTMHKNQSCDKTGREATFLRCFYRYNKRASDSGQMSVTSLVISLSTPLKELLGWLLQFSISSETENNHGRLCLIIQNSRSVRFVVVLSVYCSCDVNPNLNRSELINLFPG